MIPRYSRPAMAALWRPEAKFSLWRDIELLAVEAQERLGAIPAGTVEAARAGAAAPYTPARLARIEAIERDVRHDVIAFLTELAEQVGPASRHIHRGLTSSDIVDTAFSATLVRAADLLLEGVDGVRAALRARAEEHRRTLCVGRSHGIHAEPTTFGLKMLRFWAEFTRARARLRRARAEVAVCALSGPVGTFSSVDPAVEAHVASALGLRAEPVSTQIIPRDRHAQYFATLGVVAGSVENLAVEIRHLQRTEVREAAERFAADQKGSSAMPHKRNPILSENLTGLARLVRGAVAPAMENIALWHERDISHSAVERVIGPDATVTLDFALHRLAGVVEGLEVDADRMLDNLNAHGGLHNSQAVLLALTERGMSREDAYRAVQAAARRAWAGGGAFRDLLLEEPAVAARMPARDLDALFDPARFTRHVDAIFERAFSADVDAGDGTDAGKVPRP